MKARFLLIAFLAFVAFAFPMDLSAQTETRDDIYINKNPNDYYDRKDFYDEEEEEEEVRQERRRSEEPIAAEGYSPEDEHDERITREDRYDREADDDFVCRRGHHYRCRHDRHVRRHRSYWFPGVHVTVSSGRHGYVSTKVWVPGRWEYSASGRRYWVPGHHRHEKVRW